MTELLTAADIAQRLRCSAPHVRALWDAGELPHISIPGTRPGRRMRRLDAETLERWIEDRRAA